MAAEWEGEKRGRGAAVRAVATAFGWLVSLTAMHTDFTILFENNYIRMFIC